MAFVPRTADEITESALARLVARSQITDTTEGSDAHQLCRTVAEEIAYGEYRLLQMRNSFNALDPNISIADFKERCKDIAGFTPLLNASASSGSVFSIIRQGASGVQVVPAGMLIKRSDGSELTYRTVVDVPFANGITQVTNVYVVCTTPGLAGRCGTGVLSRALNAPSWVSSVVNTVPLQNGDDAEDLASAQQRLALYYQSLNGSQQAALCYLARSFVSTDGVRAKFAKAFVDPLKPGYGELVVDDGSGFEGLVAAVDGVSGTVPVGGQTTIVHQGPSTASVGSLAVTRAPTHTGPATLTEEAGHLVSLHEAGWVYVPSGKDWSLLVGDVFTVAPLLVYTGYIAELQKQINGDVNDPAVPGWSAFGCRVSVQRPTKQWVELSVHVVPQQGVDLTSVEFQATEMATLFINNLGPGEPLYVAALVAALMVSPDILNVQVTEKGTNVAKNDVYPADKTVLRTDSTHIDFLVSV